MRTVVLLVIWLGFASASVLGQEKAPAPRNEEGKPVPRKLVLTVGSAQRLQMSKKQVIKTVINDNEGVVRIHPADDPRTVLITALAPGRARVTLISEDGKKESLNFGKPSENEAVAKR